MSDEKKIFPIWSVLIGLLVIVFFLNSFNAPDLIRTSVGLLIIGLAGIFAIYRATTWIGEGDKEDEAIRRQKRAERERRKWEERQRQQEAYYRQQQAYEQQRGQGRQEQHFETEDNPFRVLGVSENASDDEVKAAWQRLIMKHHPDKNPRDRENAKRKSQKINDAYTKIKEMRGWKK